jgi:hypothetical protein
MQYENSFCSFIKSILILLLHVESEDKNRFSKEIQSKGLFSYIRGTNNEPPEYVA